MIDVLLHDEAESDGKIRHVSIAECNESLLQALVYDHWAFVRRLSLVIVVRAGGKDTSRTEHARSIGTDKNTSVDEVTRFIFQCPNSAKGCTFVGTSGLCSLENHTVKCAYHGTKELLVNIQHARKPSMSTVKAEKDPFECMYIANA